MSKDLRGWQPIAWANWELVFGIFSILLVQADYIRAFGPAWKDWLRSSYVIRFMTLIAHLLWAAGSYFVWASKDQHNLQRPATWDSEREALVLYFCASLPVMYLIASVLFWRWRQVALGVFAFMGVFLLNCTAFILCLLNDSQEPLTCVLIVLPIIWEIILLILLCMLWYQHGSSMGPKMVSVCEAQGLVGSRMGNPTYPLKGNGMPQRHPTAIHGAGFNAIYVRSHAS